MLQKIEAQKLQRRMLSDFYGRAPLIFHNPNQAKHFTAKIRYVWHEQKIGISFIKIYTGEMIQSLEFAQKNQGRG